jgi:hypothetical protein
MSQLVLIWVLLKLILDWDKASRSLEEEPLLNGTGR